MGNRGSKKNGGSEAKGSSGPPVDGRRAHDRQYWERGGRVAYRSSGYDVDWLEDSKYGVLPVDLDPVDRRERYWERRGGPAGASMDEKKEETGASDGGSGGPRMAWGAGAGGTGAASDSWRSGRWQSMKADAATELKRNSNAFHLTGASNADVPWWQAEVPEDAKGEAEEPGFGNNMRDLMAEQTEGAEGDDEEDFDYTKHGLRGGFGVNCQKTCCPKCVPEDSEPWLMLWSAFKLVAYLGALIFAIYLLTNDFKKVRCWQLGGSSDCLVENYPGQVCSGPSESTCQANCFSQPSFGGCYMTYISGTAIVSNPVFVSCLNETYFESVCINSNTCPDSSEDDPKNTIIALITTISINVLLNLMFLMWFAKFKGMIYEDFITLGGRLNYCLLACSKFFYHNVKLFAVVEFVIWLVGLYLVLTKASDCSNALTITGSAYTFFDDATIFMFYMGAVIVVLFVLGSVLRHQCPLRGELYYPTSASESAHAPLDCCYGARHPSARFSSAYRVSQLSGSMVIRACARCGLACADCICCTIIADGYGESVDYCWRHANEIGP